LQSSKKKVECTAYQIEEIKNVAPTKAPPPKRPGYGGGGDRVKSVKSMANLSFALRSAAAETSKYHFVLD
jgi:hypothetical protein